MWCRSSAPNLFHLQFHFLGFLLYHFQKIHRKVLCKITIDLLYFWDVYDINLWEKNFGSSTAYSCRTNIFYINFIVLRKNDRHSWRLNKSSKTFQINRNLWVFLNRYIRNTYFPEHLSVNFFFFFFFLLQCVKQEFSLFISSKNQTPCTCFLQTGYF